MIARLLLALALLVIGCTQENPVFCDETRPCAEGACDLTRNACAAVAPCRANVDCGTKLAPICGEFGLCRGCGRSYLDCSVRNPALGVCDAGSCRSCTEDSECPRTLPACQEGVCSPCKEGGGGDALCAERGDDATTCRGGACSQCTVGEDCNGLKPICELGLCRGCQQHTECLSNVCGGDGSCLPENDVLFVSRAGSMESPCGTAENPCALIEGALSQIAPSSEKRIIRVLDGNYDERIKIDARHGAGRVTLLGPTGAGKKSTLRGLIADDGAVVEVANLDFHPIDGEQGDGVVCDGRFGATELVLRGISVSEYRVGIRAENCRRLEVRRSEVLRNQAGGLSTDANQEILVQNSLFWSNGSSSSNDAPIKLSAESAKFLWNTVVGNQTGQALFSCSSVVELSNNILRGNSGVVSRGKCNWSHSLFDVDGVEGVGNLVDDPLFLDEFAEPPNARLSPVSIAIDSANDLEPPALDLAGNPRVLGGRADLGAYEAN